MNNAHDQLGGVAAELKLLRGDIQILVEAVLTLPSVHEVLVGLFIAGRLANSAGPSAIADTLIPQLGTLADMVVDHFRVHLGREFWAKQRGPVDGR
jgi:hypothetical protein